MISSLATYKQRGVSSENNEKAATPARIGLAGSVRPKCSNESVIRPDIDYKVLVCFTLVYIIYFDTAFMSELTFIACNYYSYAYCNYYYYWKRPCYGADARQLYTLASNKLLFFDKSGTQRLEHAAAVLLVC